MKTRLIAGTINKYEAEEGWANVHIDISPRPIWDHTLNMPVLPEFVGSITDLTEFREETFDEVKAHHVLEHLVPEDVTKAIDAVYRVLKPGGVFDVEVPDVYRIAVAISDGEINFAEWNQWLYGEVLANHEPGDTHRSGWSENTLRFELSASGFDVGGREETGLALRFVATKPGVPDA